MKTKNLLLLPSTLATMLIVLPFAQDYALKLIDSGKLDKKETTALVFTVFGIVIQSVLRYQEGEGTLHTPKGLPGKDTNKEANPFEDKLF